MRGLSLNRVLGGTALALVMAAGTGMAFAGPDINDNAAISAAVPMPESADLPPPSIADIGSAPAAAAPAAPAPAAAAAPAPAAAVAAPASAAPETTAKIEAPAVAPAAAAPVAAPAPAVAAPETVKAEPERPAAAAPATAKVESGPPATGVDVDTAPALQSAEPAKTPAAAPAAAPAKDVAGKDAQQPAAVAATDPVTEKLRELVPTKLSRFMDRKREQSAVEAFYRDRDYAPLWIENGAESARAKAAIARLKIADRDGLDPTDFTIPDFSAATPDALAEAELRLTNAVLIYARQAMFGRVHWSRVSRNIDFPGGQLDVAETLAKLGSASDVAAALDSYNPPHKGFRALRAKLAELRGAKGKTVTPIPSGPVLKIGMQDDRVPLLRERLGLEADNSTKYDAKLAEAVKKFQKANEIGGHGRLTAATVEALNGPTKSRQIDIIVANLERWRWLPRDLGNAYTMVNIPDYTLKVVHNGQTVWTTKIVAGKPSTPTPLISVPMQHIVVNPTWYVPPSIIYGEYLPALQQDPTVLQRMGLVLERSRDGSVSIRQPPGDGNALGRMKFAFPNKFLVYQHDTPQKYYFKHERRAYSHGCMRVEDPPKYGEVILSILMPEHHYTAERLRKMYGGGETYINLPKPFTYMVHLTYQSAYVDDRGKLVMRDDVYGLDSRTLAALKEDHRVADIAVSTRSERSASSGISSRRRAELNRAAERSSHSSGFSFFERLFR